MDDADSAFGSVVRKANRSLVVSLSFTFRTDVQLVQIPANDGSLQIIARETKRDEASNSLKFVQPRPYATAEAARLFEIAKAIGADLRGMIPIGAWNTTFLNRDKASVAEYAVGRDHLFAGGAE